MSHTSWGVEHSPFRPTGGEGGFQEIAAHEEASARLEFLVNNGRRLGILLGEEGTGKSLLMEVFARRMGASGRPVACLNLLTVDPSELVRGLLTCFGVAPHQNASLGILWRQLTDRLTEFQYERRRAIVLLDDVDRGEKETLEQVVRLAQFGSSPEAHLTLVLSGRPERIGDPCERLLELAELRIDLTRWNHEDTRRFVHQALTDAGRQDSVFDDSAIDRLYALTQGIPRRVCQLADLALLAGQGSGVERIGVSTIDSVCRELGGIEVS